jgi:hypothetical protein
MSAFSQRLPNWLYRMLRCRNVTTPGRRRIQCERWLHVGGEHR